MFFSYDKLTSLRYRAFVKSVFSAYAVNQDLPLSQTNQHPLAAVKMIAINYLSAV